MDDKNILLSAEAEEELGDAAKYGYGKLTKMA